MIIGHIFAGILGICSLLSGILGLHWLFTCGVAAFIVIAVVALIYMNTGNRFLK